MTRLGIVFVLFALLLAGCSDDETTTTDDEGAGAAAGMGGVPGGGGEGGIGGDGGAAPTIPACGTNTADTFWLENATTGPHNTPEVARPMGIVTQPVQYIEGTVDAVTATYFYVFCTGPQFTQFDLLLFENTATIDFVHIHDGDGNVMGPELPPTTMTSPLQQSWTLMPSHQYLLEVHAPGGGFF